MNEYENIVKYCVTPMITVASNGDIIEANIAACKLFGYTQEDLQQLNFINLTDKQYSNIEVLLENIKVTDTPKILLKGIKENLQLFFAECNAVLFYDTQLIKIISLSITNITDEANDTNPSKNISVNTELTFSNSRLDKIISSSLDVICAVDKEGNFLYVSNASENVWGYKPAELIGKKMMDLVHTDDLSRTIRASENVMAGNPHTNFENRYIRKDGSIIEISWSDRWDEEEQIRYAVARDNTQNKVAELYLKDSEEKYRKLFICSPIPKWIFDTETLNILDVNQAAVEHYGYNRAEFLSLSIKDISPSDNLLFLLNNLRNLKSDTNGNVFGIFTHHKKDNTLIQVEVNGNFIYYLQKQCVVVECVDVSKREKAYNKLLDREIKLTNAQHVAKLGYWQYFLKDKTLFISEELYKIGNVPLDYPIKIDSLLNVVHRKDKERFIAAQLLSLKNGSDFKIEYRIILQDKSIKWLFQQGVLKHDGTKNIKYFEGTIQDITTRKNQEVQKKLISTISNLFINNSTIKQTLVKLLDELFVFGEFSFSEVWLLNAHNEHTTLEAYFYNDAEKLVNKNYN